MVIGNNHLHASLIGLSNLDQVTNPTVDGNQQTNSLSSQLAHCCPVKPIALTHPMGNIGADLTTHRSNNLRQQRYRSHPVSIKVTIDGHQLPTLNSCANTRSRLSHPPHQEGIMKTSTQITGEKCGNFRGITQIAIVEQTGEQWTKPRGGDKGWRSCWAQLPMLAKCGHGAS